MNYNSKKYFIYKFLLLKIAHLKAIQINLFEKNYNKFFFLMQVTISDSDLIREKLDHLFHDKTTKILNNYAKTNLIIINPSALIDIFYLARISSKENLDLLDLLKTINKIISKDAINSLSVYSEGVLHYSGNSKRSLARYIIEFYYELREKKMDLELLEEVKKILIFLVRNNYLERSVIRVIYQQVIKEYYQGFVFKETIENSINMLYVNNINNICNECFKILIRIY